MCEALKILMKDEIAEEVMEVQKKNALKFYKQGQTPDFIADFLEVPIELVKQWLGLATT